MYMHTSVLTPNSTQPPFVKSRRSAPFALSLPLSFQTFALSHSSAPKHPIAIAISWINVVIASDVCVLYDSFVLMFIGFTLAGMNIENNSLVGNVCQTVKAEDGSINQHNDWEFKDWKTGEKEVANYKSQHRTRKRKEKKQWKNNTKTMENDTAHTADSQIESDLSLSTEPKSNWRSISTFDNNNELVDNCLKWSKKLKVREPPAESHDQTKLN